MKEEPVQNYDIDLKGYRTLCLVGFPLIILVGFVDKLADPNAVEPWAERIIAASMFPLALGASYIFEFVRKYMAYFAYAVFYIFIAWVVRLTSLNHYSVNYSIILLVGISGMSIFFKKTSHLITYDIFILAAVLLSFYLSPQTDISKAVYIAYLLGLFVSFYVLLRSKIIVQEELVASKKSLEVIFSESEDALFLVDVASRKIIDCNRKALEMFGIKTKEELLGMARGMELIKGGFTLDEAEKMVAEILRGGVWRKEMKIASLSGKSFWADIVVKLIVIEGKRILLARASDISRIKEAGEVLTETVAKLEVQKKELEKLNEVMVGRELEMRKLKIENEELKKSTAKV